MELDTLFYIGLYLVQNLLYLLALPLAVYGGYVLYCKRRDKKRLAQTGEALRTVQEAVPCQETTPERNAVPDAAPNIEPHIAPNIASGAPTADYGAATSEPVTSDAPVSEQTAHTATVNVAKASAALSTKKDSRMASSPSRLSALKNRDSSSLLLRSALIAAITLALLVPLALVSDLVNERSYLQRQAVNNIAQLWGRSQTISGPALIIPYEVWRTVKEKVTDDDGKTRTETRREQSTAHKVVLPADLSFDAALEPQTRQYGIYEYVVYTCPIAVRGSFRLPAAEVFDDQLVRIFWDKAWFSLGVTDLKAINKVGTLDWNGASAAPFNPGAQAGNLLGPGFHAPVSIDPGMRSVRFALDLHINGSGGLHFTPVGENTTITARGQWSAPSFGGSLLPAERSVSDTEFSARWSIPHLSRTYPQVGDLGDAAFTTGGASYKSSDGASRKKRDRAEEPSGDSGGALSNFTAGVDLYETVSLYRQVDRAVKYGLLFIGLTFVALLAFELATRARLHLMQYGLVGIAMTLFYLVLLSLAEHSSFFTAFIAASGVSIIMNGLYITAALRSLVKGLTITALLAGLYAVLYALLQMEDYALLVGTALVVIVVGVLMFLTRNLPLHTHTEGALPQTPGSATPQTPPQGTCVP